MRRHPQSRNPTLLCRDRRGQRVFVKSAVRDDPGIAHERVVLRALQSIADAPVPRVLHSTRGTIALRWLEGRTLWDGRRLGSRPPDAAIGAALAQVQLAGRQAVSAFVVKGDLAQRLLWTSPELYASLGKASLSLFRQVHASRPALRALTALIEGETAERALLSHGDLRQPNIMVHRGRVTFLDWELCGLGDPARDLGMLIAEDVRAWLSPRDEKEVQSREALEQHARCLVESWERTMAELGFTPAADHRQRVLGWTGEALLRAAFSLTHHEARLPQVLVDAAIAMLESPGEAARELLGDEQDNRGPP